MRKILFLIIVAVAGLAATSQDAVFKKLPDGLAPVIDGVEDSLWFWVKRYYIEEFFIDEYPTIDVATWQAAWNDTAIFLLVSVEEDDFRPHYESGFMEWESDKPQVYFDVNDVLDDGKGPAWWPNSGHYEVTPCFIEGGNGVFANYYDSLTLRNCKCYAAFMVDEPDYVFEYAVLVDSLLNDKGYPLDPLSIDFMGFDITIIDLDEGDFIYDRRRLVWKNTGEIAESWSDMDNCGEVLFSTELVDCGPVIPPHEPYATVKRLPDGVAPVIDGKADGLWTAVEKHEINQFFLGEEPSIDYATWQAVWNDSAIFVLLTVEEDDFYPHYEAGLAEWQADRPELYFDVNRVLKDGGGAWDHSSGHYDTYVGFMEDGDGIMQKGDYSGFEFYFAHKVEDPDYTFEFCVLMESLKDKYGYSLDPYMRDLIGYDVTLVDLDEGDINRNRMVWMNTGEIAESWNNMDDCGVLKLSTEPIEVPDTIFPPGPALIKRLPDGLAPSIDGITDNLWKDVEKHHIFKPMVFDEPTLNGAYWQGLWNDTAIFVRVSVKDDSFCPAWCEPVQPDWFSDKPEIYFDVNEVLGDGQGPAIQGSGHYQFAPGFTQGYDQYQYSGIWWMGQYYHYGYLIDEPDYDFEYAVPFSSIPDENGLIWDPSMRPEIGFDVTIIDRDEGEEVRNRAIWSNTGENQESWNNMDDCGIMHLTYELLYEDTVPEGTFFEYCEFEDIVPDITILGDDTYEITDNPDKDIYNSTDKVMKYMAGSDNLFGSCMIPAGGIFYTSRIPVIKIMVYSTVSGQFILMPVRSYDGLTGLPEFAEYTNAGLWQELEFSYGENPFDKNFDCLMIMPLNTGTGTWYIDEISGTPLIYYGGKVPVKFEVTNNSSRVLDDENYIIVDYTSNKLYDDGTHGDSAAGDDEWTRIVMLDGFKLGVGGGRYLWQPLIEAKKHDEHPLFIVAGQDTVTVQYSYTGISTVGLREMMQFKVYPVPASDYIYISDADRLIQVAILDVLGKEIKSVADRHSGLLQIDISDLKQGVYFLRLTDIYGNVSTRTLLKE
jgi:hypothetical protein